MTSDPPSIYLVGDGGDSECGNSLRFILTQNEEKVTGAGVPHFAILEFKLLHPTLPKNKGSGDDDHYCES